MATTETGKGKAQESGGTLGTFGGVFTPSVLTILGIILFLRLGYIVGDAGLGRALVIIALANLISILTSFSLSAIATNFTVKGGGDYYLISRTLGREFGGSLGLVLYLAQSVSIAFYALGFGEALTTVAGFAHPAAPQIAAAGAVGVLFVLAWLGADWATRFQFGIMVVLFAAIAFFFVGGILGWDGNRLVENWSPAGNLPFWALFALFFPAVTGFTQGVSMSGDLKDSGKSLPRGTFMAVGISFVVYVGAAVVLAAAAPGSRLMSDYGVMRSISPVSAMIDAGVIAATLSSALASFLGAPRILQSLARDRIFPFLKPFAAGAGPLGNPRRGVLLSLAIALAGVALGSLNLIAPVVAMFFLISYGLLNYATYYEARTESPAFRPRFRWYDRHLSLVGCLVCLGVMLAIEPAAAVVAVALLLAIYRYIKRSKAPERWADSTWSNHFQRVREHLHAMAGDMQHERDWRPVILAFSDDAERRERILRFASWIVGRSGLTTAVKMVLGEGAQVRKQRQEAEIELRKEIADRELTAFAKVVSATDREDAFATILQASGLGPIRANTLLTNWFDPDRAAERGFGLHDFGRYLRTALRHECNVIVLEARGAALEHLRSVRAADRRIDVWWRDDSTSRLSLLLAYLMSRSGEWKGASIRILVMAKGDEFRAEVLAQIRERLDVMRIAAEPEAIFEPHLGRIVSESQNSDLAFIPFGLDGDVPVGPFGGSLDEILRSARITACVLAAQDIALDAEPDAGRAGAVASALDAAEQAEDRARAAEKEAEKARKEAERASQALESASEAPVEEKERLEREAAQAGEEAEKASRRAAKLRAKADDARRESDALVGDAEGSDRSG